MLKLLVLLTKNLPPSSRLRMTACFDEFKKHGISATGMPIPSSISGRMPLFRESKKHDVVIIQKKTSFKSIELKLLRRANPHLVFDMDDAVMFHELEHHKPLTGRNFLKFLRTIKYCQGVVAGNRTLATYAESNCNHVAVLPTPVDLNRYKIKDYATDSDTLTIGWVGVAGSLHYLERLSPVLQQIASEFPNLCLKIVSNRFIDIPNLDIIKQAWSLEEETEHLRSFDIGIMPLADTLWARGKCGYKILQYFGVGVPVISSPVGINTEFIRHGETGFLAGTDDEWLEALRQLIKDRVRRKEIGLRGRKELEEKYSLDQYAAHYADFLHRIASIQ